jgi:integrase
MSDQRSASTSPRRHPVATHISRNVWRHLPVVSARLGHSSIRTTAEIYSHAIHGQDDEATRKWEEYQQRNRQAVQPTDSVQ